MNKATRINQFGLPLLSTLSLNKTFKIMTVYDLQEGQSALIKSILTDSYTCKLLTLGLLPKAKVTYVRSAPLGGARYLKIDDHYVAIREEEAKTILIEEVVI